jgi:hypothetical protein
MRLDPPKGARTLAAPARPGHGRAPGGDGPSGVRVTVDPPQIVGLDAEAA